MRSGRWQIFPLPAVPVIQYFPAGPGAGCCARAVVTAGSALGCCSGRSGRMSSSSSCAVCGAGGGKLRGAGCIKWCPHRVQLHHSAGTGQRAGRHRGRELIQCAVLCRGKGVEMLLLRLRRLGRCNRRPLGVGLCRSTAGQCCLLRGGLGIFFCHMAQIKAALSAAGGQPRPRAPCGRPHRTHRFPAQNGSRFWRGVR